MAKTRRAKERGLLASVFIGAGLSAVVLLILSLVIGGVIYMLADPLSAIDIGSLIVLLLGGVISSFIISRRSKEKQVATALLSALLLCACLLVVGAILGGGNISPRALLNYLCYIGVALIGSWLGGRKTRRRRK